MSYPLINGTVINGASAGTQQQTQGLQPVRFGKPVLRLYFPAASLNAAPAFGAPQLAVPRPASFIPLSFGVHRMGFQGRSFLAGRFGMPVLSVSMQAVDGVAGVVFGVPKLKVGQDRTFILPSLSAVRFGDTAASLGMPPSSVMLGVAVGMQPVTLGKPAVRGTLTLNGLASLQPVGFGHALVRAWLQADAAQPVSFGTPGQATYLFAQPIYCARLGQPGLAMRFPALSTANARLGRPRVLLATMVLGASSLEPLTFGQLGSAGVRLRARTLAGGVTFGRMSVLGDTTC